MRNLAKTLLSFQYTRSICCHEIVLLRLIELSAPLGALATTSLCQNKHFQNG